MGPEAGSGPGADGRTRVRQAGVSKEGRPPQPQDLVRGTRGGPHRPQACPRCTLVPARQLGTPCLCLCLYVSPAGRRSSGR